MPIPKTVFKHRESPQRCVIGDRELHCGDCIRLFAEDTTWHARIELSGDEWYFVGVQPNSPWQWSGLPAEIER